MDTDGGDGHGWRRWTREVMDMDGGDAHGWSGWRRQMRMEMTVQVMDEVEVLDAGGDDGR